MPTISIILCTYNSEAYISELADSILRNDFKDFEILVQDDCSTDKTISILESFDDPRIKIKINNAPSGSAAMNFMSALVNLKTAPYVMFADADDFWEPFKISKTFEMMKKAEAQSPPDTPVLVHSDLSVVNENLKRIAPSLWDYEKISPERTKLNQLLAQNNVTGCTVMINDALKKCVPSVPDAFVMHDWWLALCASAFGKIEYLREPLIRYRQHGDNSVGAYDASSLSASAKKLANKEKTRRIYDSMFDQADCFAEYYSDRLSEKQYRICKAYGSMKYQSRLQKCATVFRYSFWKNTLIRNIGQFIAI